MRMMSSIFVLQMGQSLRPLLHFKQAVLCLQGMYSASLSLSQQIMQAFSDGLSYNYWCWCFLQVYVVVVPILNIVSWFRRNTGDEVFSLDKRSQDLNFIF